MTETKEKDQQLENLELMEKTADLLLKWIKSRKVGVITEQALKELRSTENNTPNLTMRRLEVNNTGLSNEANKVLIDLIDSLCLHKDLCISLSKTK
jgi:hypothetical protein